MQLNKSKIDLHTAIGTGERYWTATLILTVIIIACVAVIVQRQVEINSCWSSHSELAILKGKIQEKSNHVQILKEQTDQFLSRTFSKEDRALKEVDYCQKHLRDIEISTRQLVVNVTSLANERDKLVAEYNLCNKKLTACETTKTLDYR